MSSLTEIERPFRVVLVGGTIKDMIGGFDSETDAQARADQANRQAVALRIDARYEVKPYVKS